MSLRPRISYARRDSIPPGGSVDGTPRFEQFESGPLAAVIEYFSRTSKARQRPPQESSSM